MTIIYPLELPESPGVIAISLSTSNAVSVARSPWTFATFVQQYVGSMWLAEVSLPYMRREQAEEWISFLLSLKGQRGTFLLGDPSARIPQGSVLGNPKVYGIQFPGAEVLYIKGFTPHEPNVLKKGDYLQIQQRLYKVLNDCNAAWDGVAVADIFPPLRETVVDNETIITHNCRGIFRLSSSDTPLYTVNDAKIYELSFSAIEDV